MNQANKARNILYSLILIGGYLGYKSIDGLHLQQFALLGAVGLGAVVLVTILGWFWMLRAKKSAEYFTLKYTTVFSKYGVQMQEEQMKDLRQINENIQLLLQEIKKLNDRK